MEFNDISFNPEAVAGKSEEWFIDHCINKYWKEYPEDTRREWARQVYKICTGSSGRELLEVPAEQPEIKAESKEPEKPKRVRNKGGK